MGQELQIPASFGKGMAQAFVGQFNPEDSLAAGIGQSYGVIGYKGKVWSGRYRGERKNFVRPDDGTPAAYLDVIILGQAPTKSKSFYEKFEQGGSDGERPLCSSMDGIVPDADVRQKQADACALCPKNQWKTDPQTGRKGRECTDYKRLAVLVMPNLTKPAFNQNILEPMFLRVPPDSLNSLAMMGEAMSQQGFHYSTYVTRITFDPNKAHPSMVFRPLQPLTEQEAPLVLDLVKDPLVKRITVGDGAPAGQMQTLPPAGAATGLIAAATPSQTIQQQPAPQPQPQPLVQNVQPAPASTVSAPAASPAPASSGPALAMAGSPAAQLVTNQPTSSPASPGVETGLIGASTASVAPQPSVEAPATTGLMEAGAATLAPAADAGAPEESDAELDAKIANFLTTKAA